MNKTEREATAIFIGLFLVLMLMLWLASGNSACVKVDNKVIFVDNLVVGNSGISYTYNGVDYKSNNATYVYADYAVSCDEIFPQEFTND